MRNNQQCHKFKFIEFLDGAGSVTSFNDATTPNILRPWRL